MSERAESAARRGAIQARAAGANAGVLLHVTPESDLPQETERLANAALERALVSLAARASALAGFEFTPRLRRGAIVDEILRAAEGCGLVVTGAQGMHPLRDLALGGTAERLVRRSRSPVLVVKQPPEGPYARVLVPVDFSSDSYAAASLARRIAPSADLLLAHAYESPHEGKLRFAGVPDSQILAYRNRARDHARAEMDRMTGALGLPAGKAETSLAHGYPPTIIAQERQRFGADLVVMGKHGHSRIEDLLLGSVTLHVLNEASCDVLVVRGA